ncbi:hypothetical protein FDZ84_22135 [Saccharopolyspora sp. ASAGF58]|nr:hypothetical protein FDZ84_22135 [Saccharopolyspora sp. ASAGF58]
MISDVQSWEKEHLMSVRRMFATAAVALLGGFALATPAAAHSLAQPSARSLSVATHVNPELKS